MWKCHKCEGENKDVTAFCISCGERKTIATKEAVPPPTPQKVMDKYAVNIPTVKRLPGQNDRTCKQAIDLASWGRYIYIVSWIIGIIVFISSGFVPEIDMYGVEYVFDFTFMLFGLIPAFSIIMGGWVFNLILGSFSIIVESAYRKLKPEETTNPTK